MGAQLFRPLQVEFGEDNVKFLSCENGKVAKLSNFGRKSEPTLLFIKNGVLKETLLGLDQVKLRKLISLLVKMEVERPPNETEIYDLNEDKESGDLNETSGNSKNGIAMFKKMAQASKDMVSDASFGTKTLSSLLGSKSKKVPPQPKPGSVAAAVARRSSIARQSLAGGAPQELLAITPQQRDATMTRFRRASRVITEKEIAEDVKNEAS
eukprot:GILJ01015726.1.p1 GENE.GILJ01015726.1~~GILJ01015726.1.p1  ORF type:complete len:231 (-),score=23.96 GILJ01015726.1:101-730(-)